MTMKMIPILAGAVMASSAALAQPAAMSPAEYVAEAGAGDLYERQSSEIVLQSTQNPKVRDFAQMMVQQHTRSTADLTAAARKDNVPVAPPQLDAAKQAMMDQLRAASGASRDNLYVSQQRTAHQQALKLHRTYAESGTAPALRAAAGKIQDVVQQHITILQKL
jgi:putative membrane protein